MRWHYRDPLLVWLLPAAYALHIAEEWRFGFPEWLALVAGAPLPRSAFIAINAVAFSIMVIATRMTVRREQHGWIGVGIAAVLLINALAHLLGSLLTGTYSPGLFTAVILYVPLSQLTLMRAWAQAATGQFARGVVAGTLVHAAISALAFVLARG